MIRKALTLLATLIIYSSHVNAKPYWQQPQPQKQTQTYKAYKKHSTNKKHAKPVFHNPERPLSMMGIETGSYAFGSTSTPWVDIAKKYVGTGPSALGVRRNLWCAAAMNAWLKKAGYKGTGSDMASSFASYGISANGPRPGAIAVMSRGRSGGHVGIVLADRGNKVLLLSGNHGGRTAIGLYPKSRIYAYRLPTNSQTRYASLN